MLKNKGQEKERKVAHKEKTSHGKHRQKKKKKDTALDRPTLQGDSQAQAKTAGPSLKRKNALKKRLAEGKKLRLGGSVDQKGGLNHGLQPATFWGITQ